MDNYNSGFYLKDDGTLVITGAKVYKRSFIEKWMYNALDLINKFRTSK
jgi:hypothetical protein